MRTRPYVQAAALALLLLAAVFAFSSSFIAAAPATPAPATSPTRPILDESALAARIDEMIAARWSEEGLQPVAPSDDAEYLRRLSLDLIGRIPRVSEVRAFLDNTSPDKRALTVRRLLQSPEYATHFANVWRARMMPGANNPNSQYFAGQLEQWLRKQFHANRGYDQIVRDILTATPQNPQTSPILAFYQANESKPENLAASTSRLFLGVNLECAQCHNHPTATWRREQFWEYAAFFWDLQTPQQQLRKLPAKAKLGDIVIPGTTRTVRPRFPDDTEPHWDKEFDARSVLADWTTSPDNKFFARALVNKVWAHFFGFGLIDPIDEPSPENLPSHPAILDELTGQFIAHKFDMQYLIRAIVSTRTYQLGTAAGSQPKANPRLLSRMPLKNLTPEQIFDSIALATGFRDTTSQIGMVGAASTPRGEFLAKFANPAARRTGPQTSILQALSLMNGKFVADATSLQRSETLAAVVDAPFMDDAARLETLFLATLGRKPAAEETRRFSDYIARGGPSGDRRKALSDVMWVLLNSGEFIINH